MARLPLDGWRKQHDAVKWAVAEMVRGAGLPVEVEVYGLFSTKINRLQAFQEDPWPRPRQGMIPDLLVEMEERRQLFDVKTLHCGQSTYWNAANPRERPVDRREKYALGLVSDYTGRTWGMCLTFLGGQ